jgi:galactose-1-phosphate uridylyltransferase
LFPDCEVNERVISIFTKNEIIVRHKNGQSNRSIAKELGISKNTVNSYIKEIIDSNDVTVYDLFDTKLMDILMPTPSTVKNTFYKLFDEDNVYVNIKLGQIDILKLGHFLPVQPFFCNS